MSKVFVLDTKGKQLDMCNAGQARRLLKAGLAAVYKRYPFTIILKREVTDPKLQTYQLKLDPGSKKTGLAIVNQETGEVVFAAEIEHRGEFIKSRLDSRRAVRRSRRARKTRYRKPRFNNRTKPKDWLAPSLMSRVFNIETWVRRLLKLCPISGISLELVKFDMQLMQNPEINGTEYQQGELAGYETREYLLYKFCHKCAYCNKKDISLQVEHIIPRARGGSDRVSNLTIACEKCNQKKGTKTATEFGFPKVQAQAKASLKDASAVNSTRWATYERLKAFGLPLETGSGGLTKFNRIKQSLPKTHWIDAACVGVSTPQKLDIDKVKPFQIKATSHGSRQRCRPNKYGFPIAHAPSAKSYVGFQTGDIVKAVIPKGKYKGIHTGRVAIRYRPSFSLNGFDAHPRYLSIIHRADGYSYSFAKGDGNSSPA